MTVKELIDQLKKFPASDEVVIRGRVDGSANSIASVRSTTYLRTLNPDNWKYEDKPLRVIELESYYPSLSPYINPPERSQSS